MKYYQQGIIILQDWHLLIQLAICTVMNYQDQIPLSSILNNFHHQLNINHYLKNG